MITSLLQSFFKVRENPSSANALYSQLKAYYLSNGLYDTQISQDYYLGTWDEAMKSLRTAAHRVVEFYVSKLAPGSIPDAFPIFAENERIIEPIQQVWEWSNLGQVKSVAVRWFAMYGDVFIKVAANTDNTHIYEQFIEPIYVTDFTEDERGNVKSIRLDIPTTENGQNKTHTEMWDQSGYKLWIHQMGSGADVRYLGTPQETATLLELQISFVPFTHAKFQDIGEDRGVGSFTHALDKIDETNRMATRLHQMLFRYNKPLWVGTTNMADASGRPMPPPSLEGLENGRLELEDDSIVMLPGMAKLEGLVPNLRYGDALSILQSQIDDLEKDLPELAYDRLKEKGDLSGKAVRLLLSGAVDKVKEARGNFETALSRADAMALSMGAGMNLFSDIGSYDKGDFDHKFRERDVLPIDEDERATTLKTLSDAGLPLPLAAKIAGYPDEIVMQLESSQPVNVLQ